MTEIEKRPENGLDILAQEINEEHHAFLGALRKTAEHGIRAGELLAKAKEQCPHGTWLPWLEKHFEGSVRTAQEYMRLYAHRDEVRAKTRDAAHLSIGGALKEIAAPSGAASDSLADLPPDEQEIFKRANETSPFWAHLPLESLLDMPDNRRRGFLAELAWRAMVWQGTEYASVLHQVQESIESVTPELLAKLQVEADKLRWWVAKVEWIESIVRACDWPPGRGMPEEASDEEKKHLPLSKLYSTYEGGISEDGDTGLCSPRARIREFCGPVV